MANIGERSEESRPGIRKIFDKWPLSLYSRCCSFGRKADSVFGLLLKHKAHDNGELGSKTHQPYA